MSCTSTVSMIWIIDWHGNSVNTWYVDTIITTIPLCSCLPAVQVAGPLLIYFAPLKVSHSIKLHRDTISVSGALWPTNKACLAPRLTSVFIVFLTVLKPSQQQARAFALQDPDEIALAVTKVARKRHISFEAAQAFASNHPMYLFPPLLIAMQCRAGPEHLQISPHLSSSYYSGKPAVCNFWGTFQIQDI